MKTAYCKIIPCLDVKDGRLVKGVNFVNLKEIGAPAESAAAYDQAGADELVFLDISATLEGRRTLLDAVGRTVDAITIPLTVGGGIRSLDDMQTLFDLGVAKISVNSAAVRNPELIRQAAEKFGSDKITVAIDTRKSATLPSGYEVVVRGGTEGVERDAVEWARQAEALGAGAILPTSMDTDGKQNGYDLPMNRAIADAVRLPVIASGGAGALEHLYEAVADGHADAVLVASIAHFGTFSIRQMKEYLDSRGIGVRM
ncbi:MAG TPA: imidazole glycerol phosphate synthase subunit HisF [Planctomycetaceae bacterium]|nr:imidazole glycerol phosphate synthase subunit HisF [Planctomycetaceae bacterium]